MNVSVYIATSLDGFIARPDGGIDWLTGNEVTEPGEDYGYQAFIETIDAMVIGRGTFDKVLTFGDWPYGDMPVFVLSTRPLVSVADLPDSIEHMSCSPVECLSQLGARGVQHIYLDGGRTIQAFLRDGLVNRLIVTKVPVLIGTGITLFGPLEQDVRLKHVATRSYASGLVQSEYAIA